VKVLQAVKKRPRHITFLLIPDDQSEPYSFKLGYRWFQFLLGLFFIFFVSLVAGAALYGRLAKVYYEYDQLKNLNERLIAENQKIQQIAQNFVQLKRINERIKSTIAKRLPPEPSANKKNTTGADLVKGELALPLDMRTLQSGSGDERGQVDLLRSIPSIAPLKGFVTREYESETSSGNRLHSGIDIAAREGTLIRASGDGLVLFAGWNYEGGNMIIIYHGRGYFSIYKHNQNLLVSEQQFVQRGQSIALLGNSGKITTGPHLHFEIWKDGNPIDPRELIFNF
jgi:murein DD-endopeptidase MepM/ murein hydrolase activator NlpD